VMPSPACTRPRHRPDAQSTQRTDARGTKSRIPPRHPLPLQTASGLPSSGSSAGSAGRGWSWGCRRRRWAARRCAGTRRCAEIPRKPPARHGGREPARRAAAGPCRRRRPGGPRTARRSGTCARGSGGELVSYMLPTCRSSAVAGNARRGVPRPQGTCDGRGSAAR
jgi:hypothetical protein